MPMEPALAALLTQTITDAPYVGQDAYGKPSYGPAETHPARIEYRVETILNAQGQEQISSTVVYVDGDWTPTIKSRITLPDGTAPTVQMVQMHDDPLVPGTTHHW